MKHNEFIIKDNNDKVVKLPYPKPVNNIMVSFAKVAGCNIITEGNRPLESESYHK